VRGHGGEVGGVAGDERELRAGHFLGKDVGDGGADALRGTGDEDDGLVGCGRHGMKGLRRRNFKAAARRSRSIFIKGNEGSRSFNVKARRRKGRGGGETAQSIFTKGNEENEAAKDVSRPAIHRSLL